MDKKLIVITGASSGFGAEIARQFSALGHPLLLLARRTGRLYALNLPHTLCRSIDVNDRQSFVEAIDEAEERYGPVDCIVNNAGIMLLGSIEQQGDTEWRKMFETNVLGLLNGMSIVLESMKKNQRGTIINISSLAGRKTYEHHAAYSGTKFAVHGISETVRWEMAPYNIRVITLAPGAAETELLDHITSDQIVDEYRQWKSDIGGVMSAEEVAKSVVFAYSLPQSVCIRELVIAPTKQQN
ncbi:SDR family oxidoreductase [Erwiniaceae bacterium BAC15a-03b]|uniref:SDR family oxidoreductase n=1 Tax=Winslowiella arboricola TaxID=2978220 RepID=A0A9J6PYV8_9GAMM|nr:SDR family oxidoreductase [Winslowiella arboricola]MCU5772940.1 SDR family oxidoreductase [Winslowiella arboricola]MCU5780632.1 SDR family oxidoreductase [Winslowiella arboricola]